MTEEVNFAFLHGGGQGSWVWQSTIAALDALTEGKSGRVLALDVPGCGEKRGRDTSNISFAGIIDELIADLEDAGMRDVVLVGHSQAGTVLPHLVEKRPDLFRRLIYVSCSIPLPGQNVIQMINDVHRNDENIEAAPQERTITGQRERTEIMFCNDMAEEEAAEFIARLGDDQWPSDSYVETNWQFKRLEEVPATYVVCLRDNILPESWQQAFADRFGAERLIMIDAGHQVMNTRPHALAEALLREARK